MTIVLFAMTTTFHTTNETPTEDNLTTPQPTHRRPIPPPLKRTHRNYNTIYINIRLAIIWEH